MLELEVFGLEFLGQYFCAGQYRLIGHLAEHEFEHAFGNGYHFRPVQGMTDGMGEFLVANRVRRDNIDRALERFMFNGKFDCADGINNLHPTDPLLTVAEWAAHTHLKRRQHLRQ